MMLSDLAIRRPVFAWMLMLGLLVFGAISFKRMGVSMMPDVDFPLLNISVNWEGAAPELLEAEIERVKAHRDRKAAHRSAADALFAPKATT